MVGASVNINVNAQLLMVIRWLIGLPACWPVGNLVVKQSFGVKSVYLR